MQANSSQSRGQLLAAILAGSWRESPGREIDISEEQLELAAPQLEASASGPLGWWRVRESKLRTSPSGEVLHQSYRLAMLQARIHQAKTEKAIRLLRAAGVEAILFKGWSIARRYPQPGLRPYGDIDVCVRPDDYRQAKRVAESDDARACTIDLHRSILELEDRSVEDLFARSKLVPCGAETVRLLADEDHFALLAIHLLKHGAWRPLWLCDISMFLESLDSNFNWSLCLGSDRRQRNWIFSVIGLARVLLDASVSGLSPKQSDIKLPDWVVESVLRQWSNLYPADHLPIQAMPLMSRNFRSPRAMWAGIRKRWPDPITATFKLKSSFNRLPRLPYQLAAFTLRAGQFVIGFPGTGKD